MSIPHRLKQEKVLLISLFCALLTMLFVPPDNVCLTYIDLRVLCLLLCLLTVFRVLPYPLLTAIVLLRIFFLDRKLFSQLDHGLLATFVCFFIVSGNLGRMDAVRDFLRQLLAHSTLLTAAGASQVISNVPAAVLLSSFTEDWKALLEGVNIGGLGTPIASLASLITLKQYLSSPGARAGRYLLVFTAANVFGLMLLLAIA